MLLGDADVEEAPREALLEGVEARTARHGGGDGNDIRVALGLFDQRLREDLGVGGCCGLGFEDFFGHRIEAVEGMIVLDVRCGERMAFALLGDHVQHHSTRLRAADERQHVDEMLDVVAVDGAYIGAAKLLEHRRGCFEFIALAAHARLYFGGRQHRARFDQVLEVIGKRADRRRNRHAVVVEDHGHAAAQRAGVVDGLVGHAGTHGAVADDGDHMVVLGLVIACDRHAQGRRDRRRAVGRTEGVERAFLAQGEAVEAALLADRADAGAPAGEDLVGIGLMTHVPDQTVRRRVINVVQRDGQLDHTEAGTEVSTGDRSGIDGLGAQFVGQLAQLVARQRTQLLNGVDAVEQRCRKLCQDLCLLPCGGLCRPFCSRNKPRLLQAPRSLYD